MGQTVRDSLVKVGALLSYVLNTGPNAWLGFAANGRTGMHVINDGISNSYPFGISNSSGSGFGLFCFLCLGRGNHEDTTCHWGPVPTLINLVALGIRMYGSMR